MANSNSCPELSDLDVAEAYSLAVTLEDEGYKFYNNIIEKLDDVRVKNELTYLRDEELKHKAIFEKLLKNTGEEFVKNEKSDLHCWVNEQIVEPMKEALEKELPSSATQALRVGILLEDKAIQMFDRIRQIVSDKEGIKAIKNVLKEEKKHKKRLTIILAY